MEDLSVRRPESEESEPSFASRWRGKFRESRRDDVRFKVLARKYLGGAAHGRSAEKDV